MNVHVTFGEWLADQYTARFGTQRLVALDLAHAIDEHLHRLVSRPADREVPIGGTPAVYPTSVSLSLGEWSLPRTQGRILKLPRNTP